MPCLIAHLADPRPTAGLFTGNGFGTGPERMSDVREGVLDDLTGNTLMQGVNKASAEAWLAEALKVGERDFVTTRIVDPKKYGLRNTGALCAILIRRYPQLVLPTYEEAVTHGTYLGGLERAIFDNPNYTKSVKIKTFQLALTSTNGWARSIAARYLKSLGAPPGSP